MNRICLTALFGLGMSSALVAQISAPEVVGNTIWKFNQTAPFVGPTNSLFMASDGTAYNLSAIGTPLIAPRPYRYRKTGPTSAVLEFGLTSANPYTLRFNENYVADYQAPSGSGVLSISPLPLPAIVALRNVSTRVALAAEETSLAGFVVKGNVERRVLVRAVGPTLAQFGVANPAPGTALSVWRGASQLAANRGWGGGTFLSTLFTKAGAFALPAESRDSALFLFLPPGDYVAQARADGGSGEVLIEVYFLDY